MSSVIQGTVHTHTGNVKNPSKVRYFPASRGPSKKSKESDIRFRGENLRLLRTLVYKNKEQVGQLRAHVIIMDISMWSNQQLLAFNILYPNSLDSLSNKEKRKKWSTIEQWNIPLDHHICPWYPVDEQFVSDVLEVRATQEKYMTKHKQQTMSGVEIQMGGWSKSEKKLISSIRANAETSQLIELKAKSEKENRKQTLLDEQENISSTIIQLKEQIMKCKEKQKKVKTELKKIEKKEKNKKKREEIQAIISKAVEDLKALDEEDEELDELKTFEEEELEEIEEEEVEEEETPEFPGEEELEEIEHDDLEKYTVDFYVDDDFNVWDENMCFVGKFNAEDDTLKITEGYEPEDEEEDEEEDGMSPLIQNFNFQRELEEDEKAQHFSTEEELEESKHVEGSECWGLVDGNWRKM